MSEGALFQILGPFWGPLPSGRHWGPRFRGPLAIPAEPGSGFFPSPLPPLGPCSWPARVKPETAGKLAVTSLTPSL